MWSLQKITTKLAQNVCEKGVVKTPWTSFPGIFPKCILTVIEVFWEAKGYIYNLQKELQSSLLFLLHPGTLNSFFVLWPGNDLTFLTCRVLMENLLSQFPVNGYVILCCNGSLSPFIAPTSLNTNIKAFLPSTSLIGTIELVDW